MAEKRGLLQRFIIEKDKDENYVKSNLALNRKELLWNIIKIRFWKLVLINIMLIIGLSPIILILLNQNYSSILYSAMLPFSGGLFAGYPYIPDLYEFMFLYEFNLQGQMLVFFLPEVMFFGLIMSGIFYIMRNFVRNQDAVIAKDFWKGFKTNWLHFIIISFFLGLIYTVVILSITLLNYTLVFSPLSFFAEPVVNNLMRVLAYVIAGFITIMAFYAFTITVTYKVKFWQLIKNSLILTLGLLPRNILLLALSVAPFLLILLLGFSNMISSFVFGVILMIGFSFAVLLWSTYSHWVFDTFINDIAEEALKKGNVYEKADRLNKPEAKKSYYKNPKKKKI